MIRARASDPFKLSARKRLIFCIADHFEPSWMTGGLFDLDTQKRRLDAWCVQARITGEKLLDADGTKFRHTNFYPAEQYDADLLATLSDLQREGLGEVEIHLHHGVEKPDTAENLERELVEFRDIISSEHKCLSRTVDDPSPKYAFVHGNWALGNSSNNNFCGVDNELEILRDTGCYVDMTLPSAPDPSQVPMLNSIYECALPLSETAPHKKGNLLKVGGGEPVLPVIITGPLMFDWQNRAKGIFPKLENGELAFFRPHDVDRLKRWVRANVIVQGRPDWIFVKLHCHGFFDHDREATIGEDVIRFFSDIIDYGEGEGNYSVHFASAREMFNMVMAAVDGKTGTPNDYRNYKLRQIMDTENIVANSNEVSA